MASSLFDSILFGDLWGTEELRRIFCDENRVQKWYDLEAALALEQAEMGIIPREASVEIEAKARVEYVDLHAIAAGMATAKHSLVPALRALQELCGPQHGEWLHYGPTTQDVIDTGTVLQLKQAHAVFLRDLREVGHALYKLAQEHRDTPMAGRTQGIQALPTTFGHKCAIWLREMARHHERLREAEPRAFVGSLAGAVGTMASFGPRAFELEARVMRRLGLGCADIAWHTARDRHTEYVGILGLIGGTLSKMCNEVFNLQRTEIDELQEPFNEGKVGSSTMPHKRNPTVVGNVIAAGKALRYNATMMAEAMVQEHERDAMSWKAEWKALPESCLLMGVMLERAKYVFSNLVVNAGNMRRNLDLLRGYLLSERVMFALSDKLGKQTAHELVYQASMRGQEQRLTLAEALLANAQVREAMNASELHALFDPTTYVGLAPQLVDRALKQTDNEGWLK